MKAQIGINTALAFLGTVILFAHTSLAQSLDNNSGAIDVSNGAPPAQNPPVEVGRKAAQKYMSHSGSKETVTRSSSISSSAHYLAIDIGGFVADNSYNWGPKSTDQNVGRLTTGVTYRIGEWINAADLAIRVDYSNYAISNGPASKLSFLPMIMFPDASSHFPLYFGAAAGPGIFLTQVPNQSVLSLDYQLVLGVRFFNVVQSTGFFVEAGLKNQLFILSSGQFNGEFVAVGAVFSF